MPQFGCFIALSMSLAYFEDSLSGFQIDVKYSKFAPWS